MMVRALCLGLCLSACAVEEYDPSNQPGNGTGDACRNGRLDAGESDVDCGGGCAPCATGRSCNDNDDCASGYCGPGYVCQPASCGNGSLDGDETAVDCGGSCPACDNESCTVHADCAGGYCQGGTCRAASCSDSAENGFETDIDCGGPICPTCATGGSCRVDSDCAAGFCAIGVCSEASCTDSIRNQGESDIDCGGPCVACATGQHCNSGSDCVTGFCNGDVCADVLPSCSDGITNGTETDVDCGGACDACGFGKHCQVSGDCRSELCNAGTCDEPATCDDGEQSPGETDVDCGGPCSPCATGKFCELHTDCLSATCIYGVCENPTCSDQVHNQGEADVDCGGPCVACADGLHCLQSGDCLSAQCELNVCISCTDGVKNGTESDIDCGGDRCAGCADGSGCRGPSDCQHGGCEGNVCCAPNACGACAATPEEICDGIDNDCDGQTDEVSDIGPAPLCDTQAGVCAGARSDCRGFDGWVCDAGTFQAHDAAYETTELTCDFVDNDCDGGIDEGLRNACNTCGPAPTEVCNGFDDNCDGSIDEAAACALCSDAVVADNIQNVSSSWGWQKHWSHWMAMLGDQAFVLFYSRGSGTTYLAKCGDGDVIATYQPGISGHGNMSIASGGGSLHVGAPGYSDSCGFVNRYHQVSGGGTILDTDVVADGSNIGGSPAAVAWGDGRPWLGYWTPEQGARYASRDDAGTWNEQGTVPDSSYGMQLVVDGNGDPWSAWTTDPYDDGSIMVQRIGEYSDPLCSHTCGSPAIWVGPDGLPAVVYRNGSSIEVRRFDGSTWLDAESIGAGVAPNLAFLPNGAPVVSFARADTEVWVATYNGASWETELAYTSERENDHILGTAIGVDSAGRYHLALSTYTGTSTSERKWIDYLMFCPTWTPACTPSCGAAECGPDGCGGSCGTCATGSCADGTCQSDTGPTCGGSDSCAGACGGQSPDGCWCNPACVGYGDCCPDYQACCG